MVSQDLKGIIDRHRTITILSHINPDADAIGTSLGIYALLKAYNKQVEVAIYGDNLPNHLDFLPNFSKIKNKIDYSDSLIIACDCGSVDRLGFDLNDREIINIDHHPTNQNYGILNIVEPLCCASSQVAHSAMEGEFPITADVATCFYAALISDTNNFTTSGVDDDVFAFGASLMRQGADHKSVTYNLTQRRSLASARVLQMALGTLTLHKNATVASLYIDSEMFASSGAKMSDIDGVVEYARSLATVEIAILVAQQKESLKISLRSKGHDISPICQYFGGGGHKNACGFEIKDESIEEILDKILKQINI